MKKWMTMTSLILAVSTANAQIPEKWAKNTVVDTVNVPIEDFWPIFHSLNLAEVAAKDCYKKLPKIVKTSPIEGDFSAKGHSRRVHFDNGQTLLESIIHYDAPGDFVYELTEIRLSLRHFAKKARGWFNFTPTEDGQTRVTWTYGFHQKNFFTKWFIKAYIKSTHRHFMNDAIQEIRRQSEAIHTRD